MEAALQVTGELKQKLRDRIPSLEEVKALFLEVLFTDSLTKQRALVRYILSTIEKSKKSGQVVDWSKMTIEHLVPQCEIGNDLPETVVGQLGNLILVSQEMNSALSNRPFPEKKRILKQAGFPLEKEIEAADRWGVEQIKARTERIALLAYNKLWKI